MMKIEIPLGKDRFGREISLTGCQGTNNKLVYELKRTAIDQRDDNVTLTDIPPEVLDSLLLAVQKVKAATA